MMKKLLQCSLLVLAALMLAAPAYAGKLSTATIGLFPKDVGEFASPRPARTPALARRDRP